MMYLRGTRGTRAWGARRAARTERRHDMTKQELERFAKATGKSADQIERALRALEREEARKEKERRYWARQALLIRKAREAGITVEEAEIDNYLRQKEK